MANFTKILKKYWILILLAAVAAAAGIAYAASPMVRDEVKKAEQYVEDKLGMGGNGGNGDKNGDDA